MIMNRSASINESDLYSVYEMTRFQELIFPKFYN